MRAPAPVAWARRLWMAAVHEERGATLVETAVSMTVMLSLMFGVLEAGMAVFTGHMVANAAAGGARYAMVHGNTCTANGASCTASSAQVQSYVQGLSYPGMNPASLSVTVSYAAFSGGSCSPNANCENPGNQVTVKASYPFVLNVPFVPSHSLQLSSTSTAVISQ